ncbi:aminoacyl-tRNA hydrolase [Ruminococcaceae bacterium OttesenSCG-928-L11]|nr:aminoacyl-tRNA hydrolase [Ruminococcaceae bacterium OttesenSCG-928-L11]
MAKITGKFKDFFAGYSATGPIEYIVVGLGNPGKQYEETRHNAGFLAVDAIGRQLGFEIRKLKFKSLCGDCAIKGKRVLFLKPSTYMNNSGEAVRDAMAFYKVPIEHVIVISDDISLEVGRMRIRRKGSDGGQKGLKSIIYLTGKGDFPRIRLGIGAKPHPEMQLADWVLSRFTPADKKALEPLFDSCLEAVELIVSGKIDEAMGKFNGANEQI